MAHMTDSLIGDASAIAELRAQVRRLAVFDTPGNPNVPTVLLQGETGTGKGLVARVIHGSGGGGGGPFVDVNRAGVPETRRGGQRFGVWGRALPGARPAPPGG